jgi:hypothetical protein
LGIDFSLSAAELRQRMADGYFAFGVYVFALILLLASTRFVFGLSSWPLANLFMGALVFRGIVGLEAFLNAREINAFLHATLPGDIPPPLITPAVLAVLALLIIFYTLLINLARRGEKQV